MPVDYCVSVKVFQKSKPASLYHCKLFLGWLETWAGSSSWQNSHKEKKPTIFWSVLILEHFLWLWISFLAYPILDSIAPIFKILYLWIEPLFLTYNNEVPHLKIAWKWVAWREDVRKLIFKLDKDFHFFCTNNCNYFTLEIVWWMEMYKI